MKIIRLLKYYPQPTVIILFFGILLKSSMVAMAQNKDPVFEKIVSLERQRTTVYQVLNQISDSIGYFFAYDSKVVKSDKRVRIENVKKPLKSILNIVLEDPTLRYKLIDKHILIYQDTVLSSPKKHVQPSDPEKNFTIKGRILDSETHHPIAFATVGISSFALGNVSNLDGVFMLKIPSNLKDSSLTITHLGYQPKTVPVSIFEYDLVDIYLFTEYISIQEVIIRNVEPKIIIKQALSKVDQNYTISPLHLNSFYREGVIKNSKHQNYSEAFFTIFKPSYTNPYSSDQVKLLKSRKSQNIEPADTLSIKLRGGIGGALQLDIIKNMPFFLDEENWIYYNFTREDVVVIGDKLAYKIGFEQNQQINYPLFRGVLYIDINSLTILGADFEINPKYISAITDQYIYKRIRRYRIRPEEIKYSVRYSQIEGRYHLSHVRGDLHFKYRRRRSLFFTPFHAFFELAVSQANESNVTRFDRKEVAPTANVFFDNQYEYDAEFWRNFNIILPEQDISQALKKINAKIEDIKLSD